ncbi:hypothetical protein EON65_41800 [archaeon]|nr:MAG: hypothetical protein EON65_41800 [archaeon]
MGVCGEHAADPDSVAFFNSIGVDYVSCSPFDIPAAKLAAAQAHIGDLSSKLKTLINPTIPL